MRAQQSNSIREKAARAAHGMAAAGTALFCAVSRAAGAGLEPPPSRDWVYGGLAVILVLAFCLWRFVFRPLRRMEDLFRRWPETEPGKRREIAAAIHGAPGKAARAAVDCMEEYEKTAGRIEEDAVRRAEADIRAGIAGEIRDSALPRPLERGAGRFALEGFVSRGARPGCSFYDFFFLDAGLLALMIGESPGDDVSSALFMVVAQTTIRSRLRMGRSLEQTMADVNTQLHDLGGGRLLHALIATLRTEDGAFSYVNAGGCRPLLMRHEERYEQLEDPVFASLGENETVSYRSVELRLRQGDRLFFSTAGLGAARGQNGIPFEREQLRAVLNRSRSQEDGLPGMLRFVAKEASACCAEGTNRMDYAAMLLEYRKGDRELAHCEVPAVPESAQAMMDFLKNQFTENGIAPVRYAKVVVLTEELFTLTCRRVRPGGMVELACGVAPDGESVTLRMAAPLGGVNPVESAKSPAESGAADFIRNEADLLSFTPEGERDVLTIVRFWERKAKSGPPQSPAGDRRTKVAPQNARKKPSFDGERAMLIHERRDGGRLTLSLAGRLDRTTAPELEETLNGALDGVEELIFDFAQIDYVSSAGLRVLLTTHLQMDGRPVILRNANEFVRDVLSVTGFLDILTVE